MPKYTIVSDLIQVSKCKNKYSPWRSKEKQTHIYE